MRGSRAIRRAPRRAPGVLAALLAVAAVAGLCSCGPRAEPRAPDVILITFERLRWEDLSPWGGAVQAPGFGRLAERSARFTRAVTCAPGGAPAALTVLTGAMPLVHGVRGRDDGRLSAQARSLASRMRARNYATGAFLQSDDVTAFMRADRDFQAWDGPVAGFPTGHPGASARRGVDETVAAGLAWLMDQPADRAGFLWLSLAEPATPELTAVERASRLGDVDRVVAAVLDRARARGASRGVAPVLVACNLSSHGPDPSRAADEAFRLEAAALRVRVLVEAEGMPAGDVAGLAGLDEVADLVESLVGGLPSRLRDLASGSGRPREAVLAGSIQPAICCGAEPIRVAMGPEGEPVADHPLVAQSIASDAGWPGGHGGPTAADVTSGYLAADAAYSLARQGRVEDAIAAFRAMDASAAAFPVSRVGLGLALMAAGDPAAAGETFAAMAGQTRPGTFAWGQARLGLARAARRAGELAKAVAVIDEIVAASPDDLRALSWRAEMSEAAGDRQGAVASVLALVEHDPENPQAQAELGRLLLMIGRPREAARALDAASRRRPTDPVLLLASADAFAASGDWWSALDKIDRRIRLYGSGPDTDFATARCWRDTHRWTLAAEYFARYVEARPDEARGRLGLAEALLYAGDERGLAEWRRARDLAPADPTPCGVLRRWVAQGGGLAPADLAAECPGSG